MKKRSLALSAMALLLVAAGTQQMKAVTVTNVDLGALSGPLTNSGTLANQGTALEAMFSISSPTTLTIFTDSYGGGTNADGTSTAAGGFMSSLVLYDGTGNYVAGETFPSPIGHNDPTTGLNGDAYIKTGSLAAGTYTVALSDFLVQQSATATNLSDGFINYGSGTTFTDVQGNMRNGNYALNISGVSGPPPSSTPEPATFWLMVPALVGAGFWIRKHKIIA